jgi:Reverse transcriptase (RNA-dependent DNA polymerase)
MEEIEDKDYPHQKELNLSDPILLGPEYQADIEPISDEEEDNLEEIIQEFIQDRYPDRPRFKQPGFDPSLPSVLPPEQMNDLNDILFMMCEEQAENAKVKGPLTKKDLPHLRQEWLDKFSDMLGGVPEMLPPFREVNYHIPLVDKQKKYNYAPSTFQRLMNSVFHDYIGVFIHVYLDNIFVFSDTIEEHQKHLELVFAKLQEQSLYLRTDKCKLHAEKVECLGHMIDKHGLHADSDKMACI